VFFNWKHTHTRHLISRLFSLLGHQIFFIKYFKHSTHIWIISILKKIFINFVYLLCANVKSQNNLLLENRCINVREEQMRKYRKREWKIRKKDIKNENANNDNYWNDNGKNDQKSAAYECDNGELKILRTVLKTVRLW